mmetsp:Transcript_108016/g.344886  ORF Transcript_108016/g.344886 Transcript_108016/m.344886 type:complete len:491 (-) Transcript_108016:295-1767(-)
MTCARTVRDIERKRREAVDGLVALSQPARARILLGLRESVKESMTHDPDMSENKKKAARNLVDFMWKNVIILTEFKTAAGFKGGRAAADYEVNAAVGHTPTFPGLLWIRAKILNHWCPFDRSIHGKLKSPFYLFLTAISFCPFFGVRLAFFSMVLFLHSTGRPADTYQMIDFIFSMKGTQFKSGGVVLFVYGTLQYMICVTPGDPHACDKRGPGSNIFVWLSGLDLIGSLIISWAAFLVIPYSATHDGEDQDSLIMPNLDQVDELMVQTGFHEAKRPEEHATCNDCFPAVCRLPWFVALASCIESWLQKWPLGARRLFVLLLYDFCSFLLALTFLWWLIRFDVASMQVESGVKFEDIHYDYDSVVEWYSTPEARISVFKARVVYHLLAMPFMILMAPGFTVLIGLSTRTGYNKQGYCVPFTIRPVAKQRWSCETQSPPASSTSAPARTVQAVPLPRSTSAPPTNKGAGSSRGGEQTGSRAVCAPRQCNLF